MRQWLLEKSSDKLSRKAELGLCLLAIAPILICFILIALSKRGLLQSPDSEFYLFIADHFLRTGEFRTPGGNPVLHWPPGYVFALILQSWWNGYVFILHGGLLITLQVLSLRLAKRYLNNSLLFVFAALIGFSTLHLMIGSYIWSELFFTVFLLGAIIQLLKFQEDSSRKHLWYFTGLLGVALITRNAGLFFVPGMLWFVWSNKKEHRWILLGAISLACIGPIAWNTHRIVIMDNLGIPGELIPTFSPVRNFILTFSEIGYNFIPRHIPDYLVAILSSGVFFFAVAKQNLKSGLIPLVVISYLVFWIIIPAHPDNIGRFIAPIFGLILILIVGILDHPIFENKWVKYSTIIYLVCFSMFRMISNLVTWAGL